MKRRLLIVCEGEVTEPEYFRGFERWARNNTVQIDIPVKRSQGLALVERATRLKDAAESAARREADAFLGYDEVWCAFDVDENDNRNLNEARQLAGANGIALAVSNPCFELRRGRPQPQHRRLPPHRFHSAERFGCCDGIVLTDSR